MLGDINKPSRFKLRPLEFFSLSSPDNWKIILRHQGMMGTIELERSIYSGSPSSDSQQLLPLWNWEPSTIRPSKFSRDVRSPNLHIKMKSTNLENYKTLYKKVWWYDKERNQNPTQTKKRSPKLNSHYLSSLPVTRVTTCYFEKLIKRENQAFTFPFLSEM